MAYVDIKDLTIDGEFEKLLPILTPEELEKLENSILQYGMLDPIKIWQEPNTGKWIVIDGHNRYNVLKKHNIEWRYWQDYKVMEELETREDVKRWMLEQQLGRRNLSPVERYEIVQKFKDVFKKKARENQSYGGKGLTNLSKVNTRKEMAKATGVSEGTYGKLDKVMKSDNKEMKQKLKEKKISIDKAYREIKDPKPKTIEPDTPEQRIKKIDTRMDAINKEISSLKTERESLICKRRSLFESLDIPCELKYEFIESDSPIDSRDCRFYIEVDVYKQILVECDVDSESPDAFYINKVPEKYRNDFLMLYKKAHFEEKEHYDRTFTQWYEKRKNAEKNKLTDDTEKDKEFYKKCFRILAKNFHPDNGNRNMEDMQCLNQLKVIWGI